MTEVRSDAGLKSVITALEILELVATAPGEIGVSQVASQLGMGRGGVFKHLQTLVARGYLWQNPDTSKYRAGIQCHLLGRLAAESVDLLSAAEQPMRLLRDALGLTVTLAVPKGGKALIVERLFGTMPMEIGVRPGSEVELHATSQGKVLCAFGKPALWHALEARKLNALTEDTITDLQALRREVQQVKAQGWALAYEEMLVGIAAVSAPIFDAKGQCVASLTIVGSIQHIKRPPDPEQIAKLQAEARAVSAQLGYRA